MDFKSDNYPETFYGEFLTIKIKEALDGIFDKIKNHKCVTCGKELDFDHFDIYDHDGGWMVVSDIPKQWISVHCDHCGYDNSINKLGAHPK